MKRILQAFAVVILTTSSLLQAQQVQKITLQDAIRIALENNFQLKQAENNLDLAEYRITSEYADFLPSLSGNFGGSQNQGQQFIADRLAQDLNPFVVITSTSFSGGLNANWGVFNGFENILSLRATQQNKYSSEEQLKRAKEQVIFDVASRFLQILLDQQLIEIAKDNLETSNKQLEQIEAQVEVGSRPRVDLFNQESQVATNELTITQRQNALQIDRLLLIRTLQVDPQGQYEFVTPDLTSNLFQAEGNTQNYVLGNLVGTALSNRSDYKSEVAQARSLKLQYDIAKGALLPTLSARAGISTRYSDQLLDRSALPEQVIVYLLIEELITEWNYN
ncbi:MAG: TolC family protein, partial [Bacteroidota bacterium]